ncbi:alpha/beta fold hydrolase [Pararhizobium mangrovi]|uniref:Alpha/beta fold hydrolase n=1 Tax=Pararhizobium mangrovi TaxID=2590452 RepID=A0A506U063_9HYPH|nr:alpha/beta fold hydrolase [Pararhizobium mangrovi]TPW27160.1 alpha/beta fold hydrolase [Pararhizobium mangrovi]
MNPLLVLLPGMMCDARLFAPQIGALSAGRAIHCAPLGETDTVDGLAEAVLRDAPPHFALAGLSMGGIVAMAVLAAAPERVARLALLDTNPLAENEAMRAKRGPQMERALGGGLAAVMREEMKPHYLAHHARRTEILDLCVEMALALGPQVFCNQSRALRDRPDRQAVLREVRVPTLVLCGREDELCPLARHELMRDLVPGAHLTVIDDAGHLPTLEKPQETTAALARWLEE